MKLYLVEMRARDGKTKTGRWGRWSPLSWMAPYWEQKTAQAAVDQRNGAQSVEYRVTTWKKER